MTDMLLLKTVDATGRAYGGFRWPLEVGATVTAPDWEPTAACGHGLHGFPWGEGDGSLLDWSKDAIWIVFAAQESEVVCFDGKAKCQTATIKCVGDRAVATTYLALHGKSGASVVGATVTGGDGANFTIRWRDGTRVRGGVGYIGEDGLLPNVAYRFDAAAKRFVAVTDSAGDGKAGTR